MSDFDVIVVGGGPGGLSATLALGRARRRVLLVDGATRRNAAATHVHTFVTRDGVPPNDFRRIAREELAAYPSVVVRDETLTAITGAVDAFEARSERGVTSARRVLLAVGMLDEMLPIPGFDALWGTGIVQCPYCHGYEQRDQRFGVLVSTSALIELALLLRNWTASVTAFVLPGVDLPADVRARLGRAGISVEDRPIARLEGDGARIRSVLLRDGSVVPCDLLFARPPQAQTGLVVSLGLELDPQGFVAVDAHRATSRVGIYAAGDLTTPMQSAVAAAGTGMQAGAMLNHELTLSSFA